MEMLELKNTITTINNSKDSFSFKKMVNYFRLKEMIRIQQERQMDKQYRKQGKRQKGDSKL